MFDDRAAVFVSRMSGQEVTDFLLDCTDDRYQQWWPGTHLQLHALARGRDHVGDVVLMDEYVGERRVRMLGIVVKAAWSEGSSGSRNRGSGCRSGSPSTWPITTAASTCGT